jgi:hypothetical protein
MALSTTSTTTEQIETVPAASQPTLNSSDAAVLMVAALAGASMTKAARRQYRKMTRKMAWQAMGYKIKSGLGFKTSGDIPDTVMGMNFWVFLAVAVGAVILGTVIFGITGFLILLGIAIIIYLLLNSN